MNRLDLMEKDTVNATLVSALVAHGVQKPRAAQHAQASGASLAAGMGHAWMDSTRKQRVLTKPAAARWRRTHTGI